METEARRPVCPTPKPEIVNEEPHRDAPVGSREQTVQQQVPDVVGVPLVVLEVEPGVCLID
jgi:hypothetical protein